MLAKTDFPRMNGFRKSAVLIAAVVFPLSFSILFAPPAEAAIGALRFTVAGTDGDASVDCFDPAIAYNSRDNEFLVVFESNAYHYEFEIWGQRIDGTTGANVGSYIRISDMGDERDLDYEARDPAVAYNAAQNEYLVVWRGDDNSGLLDDNEYEIYGQRIDAATGAEVGVNDFRISDMGLDGDESYAALGPDVAWSSANDVYLVVWYGDDHAGSLNNGDLEIFGQGLRGSDCVEIAGNDMRLSDMAGNAADGNNASHPAIAYNANTNEFLVVWEGEEEGLAQEIYGQRISSSSGLELGTNDFRISDMGASDTDKNYNAVAPDVVWNSSTNEYLVVWHGDDDREPIENNENEVFGQRLSAAGAEIGDNDFRISDAGGPAGDASSDAVYPAAACDSDNNVFLVLWKGDDLSQAWSGDDEFEVYSQAVLQNGRLYEENRRRSYMGPYGNPDYDAQRPVVAVNSAEDTFAIGYAGDNNYGSLADNEFEIYGTILSQARSSAKKVWVLFR